MSEGTAVDGAAVDGAAVDGAAFDGPIPGWLPCSDRSLERDDPLAGTAGYGERWFLVEIDGAWGTHAFLQSPLPPALARALVDRIEGAGIRPLAIRRTGRNAQQRRAQTAWRWAAVDCRVGRESVRWGSVSDPGDLLRVPLDGATGEPNPEPLICVCTHARHDQCCAVKGRPVVTALAQAYGDATWECSHLGGDRFAATLILFPHGLYYGRVGAADAPGLVEAYLRGRIEPRWFRGRSALPNAVQAAAAFVAADRGDDRIDAFDFRSWTEAGGVHTVTFTHAGRAVTATLAETLSQPLLSTCAATVARPVREFELRSVTSI
ncbi:sucrase ferredoxin [Cryobacterium sp. SO2]|uniref:sucrase ferredoxin n=1 Tax=Cryobacterium sp. SO2 TaxID=1897060 RepID=UPI00223E3F39|nr:sucrase ferredoxin [Cryobacterium sp. SO2]WEO78898.1 sucrase ferredoxin [Cryobacterium sp. SO2]